LSALWACYSLCLALDSIRTVVPGLFWSLVRRSGTHCSQMNSEIRRVMSAASNSSLKQSCPAITSVTSALEVIFNVMRSINPRFTYLLTLRLRKKTLSMNNINSLSVTVRNRTNQHAIIRGVRRYVELPPPVPTQIHQATSSRIRKETQ